MHEKKGLDFSQPLIRISLDHPLRGSPRVDCFFVLTETHGACVNSEVVTR